MANTMPRKWFANLCSLKLFYSCSFPNVLDRQLDNSSKPIPSSNTNMLLIQSFENQLDLYPSSSGNKSAHLDEVSFEMA